MALSSKDFVNQVRELNRQGTFGALDQLSDSKVYELGKKRYPNLEVEPFKELPTQSVTDVDTSPKTLNDQESWFSRVLDYGVDENSSMAHKAAFNNSMTGLAYKFSKGVDKYPEVQKAIQAGEYNPGVLEEAYTSLVSMLFPLDALTFVGSGFAGAGTKALYQKGFSTVAKEVAKKKGASSKVAERMVEGAGGLGFFMGSANTVAEMANQSEQIKNGQMKEYDEWSIAKSAIVGTLEGAALGATIGGLGSQFAKARGSLDKKIAQSKYMGGKPSTSLKIGRLAVSKPVDFGAEAVTFTIGNTMFHGAPKNKDGTLDWDGLKRNLLVNTAFLGGMKASFYGAGKVFGGLKETTKQLDEATKNKLAEATSKLEMIKELEKTNPEAVAELKKVLENEIYLLKEEYPAFKKKADRIIEVMENVTDKTTKEERRKIAKENPTLFDDLVTFNKEYVGVLDMLGEGFVSKSALDYLKDVHNVPKDIRKTLTEILADKVKRDKEILIEAEGKFDIKELLKETKDVQVKAGEPIPETILQASGLNRKQMEGQTKKQLQEVWDIVFPGQTMPKSKTTKDGTGIIDRLFAKQQADRQSGTKRDLFTDLKQVVVDKTNKFFEKKIGKGSSRLSINKYLDGLGLNAENKSMFELGIQKYLMSPDRIGKVKSGQVKLLGDYFKWLQDNNLKITDADTSLTSTYLNKLGLDGLKRKPLNDVLSVFFGTGKDARVEYIKKGFSYDYMDGRSIGEVNIGVSRKGLKAKAKKIGTVDPKEFDIVREAKAKLIKDMTNLKGAGKTFTPETFDAITEMLYEFGARGKDTIQKLKIENIDWDAGIITEWSSGKGHKAGAGARTDVPLKEVIPELWNKLVKLKGDRKEGALFTDIKGKMLNSAAINAALEPITKGLKFKETATKGKMTVQDFRRMIETDVDKMSSRLASFVDEYLVRHTQTTGRTYVITDALKMWKEFRKQRDLLKDKKVETEPIKKTKEEIAVDKEQPSIQRETDTIYTQAERRITFDYFKKKFKLTDKELLEIENLGKGKDWGQYQDGVIKLSKGEWQPFDFFHELTHFHEAYVRKTGNKKGIKLYEQLDNLVVRSKAYQKWQRKNPKLDSIEFYTDKVALEALKNERARGVGGKFKRWLQNFKSHVLTQFLGGRFAGEKDIARRLAKELETMAYRDKAVDMTGAQALIGGGRIDRARADIIRYNKKDSSFADKTKTYKVMERQIERKRIENGEKVEDIRSDLRKQRENVTDYKGGWKATDNVPVEAMDKWINFLRNTTLDDFLGNVKAPKNIKSPEAKKEWLQQHKQYRKDAYNWITSSTEKSILQDILNVKNGDINNASARQIKELTSFAKALGEKPIENKQFQDLIQSQQVLQGSKSLVGKAKEWFRMTMAPVWYAAEKMGATKISNKMLEHFVSEQWHTGKASLAENKILGHIGSKQMDRLSLMIDKARWVERKSLWDNKATRDKSGLTQKDIDFYNQIFDKNGKVRDTNQGRAYKEAKELSKYYWDEIMKVADKHYKNKKMTSAQLDRFRQEFKKKWVTDYFPRKLSREFKKYYNPNAEWMIKQVSKGVKKESKNQANEREYTEGLTFEQAIDRAKKRGDKLTENSIREKRNELAKEIAKDPDTKTIVEGEIENMFSFRPEVARNRNLSQRGIKLPEFVEITTNKGIKKIISTYETKYAETMGDYARNMSKYIATAEQYPEFTNMMKEFGFPTVKAEILDKRARNYEQAEWLLGRVKEQMGLTRNDLIGRPIIAGLQTSAMATSKLALSFPTAGLKNVLVGMPQTMATFGVFRTINAMKKAFNAESRERLHRVGAKELGMKPLEEMRTPKFLEGVFKLSLMKPTESFNRMTSIYAGRAFLAESFAQMSRSKSLRDKTVKGMKDKWKLTDIEIDVLEKYGLDPTSIKAKNKVMESSVKAIYDRALHKVDTWSHVSTQGGTSSALVPYWFNKPMWKPFLLFQRMAYAATFNLTQNVIKPMNVSKGMKNSNMLPLVRYLATSGVSGYALMKTYDYFLGVQPPNVNDEKWKQIMNYAYKAEMLGIFSEVLSPFTGGQLTTSLYPAIHKNGMVLAKNVMDVAGDKKTPYQGFKDSLKGVWSTYNQTSKILNRKMNKYNEDYLRTKRLLKDFKEDRGIEEPVIDFISKRSKYYRDFKDEFNKGAPKKAARKFLAAYLAITDSFLEDGYTIKGAQKQARAVMKSQIRNLNPNNLSKKQGNKVVSNYHDFLLYLKPGVGTKGNKKLFDMVVNAEKQYHYKWREVQREIANIIKERGLQDFTGLKHTQRKVIL